MQQDGTSVKTASAISGALWVEVAYWRKDDELVARTLDPSSAQGCAVYICNPLAMHMHDFEGVGAALAEARAQAVECGKALAAHLRCGIVLQVPEPSPAQVAVPEWAYASLCVWEAMLEGLGNDGCKWRARRANVGIAVLREDALALAPACEAAWASLSDDEQEAFGCFDFEFVPYWLNDCVEWSARNGPSVCATPRAPLSGEWQAGEEPCPINRRPKDSCPASCDHGEA
jgi:hypothetical protein